MRCYRDYGKVMPMGDAKSRRHFTAVPPIPLPGAPRPRQLGRGFQERTATEDHDYRSAARL